MSSIKTYAFFAILVMVSAFLCIPFVVSESDGATVIADDGNTYYTSGSKAELVKWSSDDEIITIPEYITKDSKEYPISFIQYDAFTNCTSAKVVALSNSLTGIAQGAFRGMTQLENIIPGENFKYQNCMLFNSDMSVLMASPAKGGATSFVIPDSVVQIYNRSFQSSMAESIQFGSGVKTIGNNAFMGSNVTSISLNEGLEVIYTGAFDGCSIPTIIIPSTVEMLGSLAFRGCGADITFTNPSAIADIGERCFAKNGDGDEDSACRVGDIITSSPTLKIRSKAIPNIDSISIKAYKEGHTFNNWSSGTVANGSTLSAGIDAFTPNKMSVTYIVNKDNYDIIKFKDVADYGTTYNPSNIIFERQGYEFDGWYIGEVKITSIEEVTSDVILTAGWVLVGEPATPPVVERIIEVEKIVEKEPTKEIIKEKVFIEVPVEKTVYKTVYVDRVQYVYVYVPDVKDDEGDNIDDTKTETDSAQADVDKSMNIVSRGFSLDVESNPEYIIGLVTIVSGIIIVSFVRRAY